MQKLTILHDIGGVLGCGCMMTALERTAACGFTLGDAHTFEEVQQAADSGTLDALVIPTDRLFQMLPALRLSEAQTRLYRNGVKLELKRLAGISRNQPRCRVYGAEQAFLGLAEADFENSCLRVYKNL